MAAEADPAPYVPDYGGDWVGAIVPALRGQGPDDVLPDGVGSAPAVVLLVLDGVGAALLDAHRDAAPTLAEMRGRIIDSVVPSTTAAALTSITTGVPPSEHGVAGFRFRVGGQVLNALRWRFDGGGRPPDPAEVQPHPPFGGEAVPVVSRAEFDRTGFTAAHLRGARLHGWRTPATIVTHCRGLLAAGARLVYAYYDGVDKIAHAHGLHDAFIVDEIAFADRLVGDLLAAVPSGTAVVVTADHGQVDVGPSRQRSLAALDGHVDRYSGEGRFRSLHARSGAAPELAAAAREVAGAEAWVATREQVVDEGWLGPRMPATQAGRLGDVVLAARAPVAFADPGYVVEQQLIGMHGSLTAEEVRVPLLAGWA